MGKGHNLVRHPDMPEEAFRDMWATIESGLPWTALVKNRRKNGDHYWVRANATPVRDGDRTVGYLSVRTRPTDDEIQQFDKLYGRMRDEAANGRLKHVLRHGQVRRADLAGRVLQFLKPELRGRIAGLAALAAGDAPDLRGAGLSGEHRFRLLQRVRRSELRLLQRDGLTAEQARQRIWAIDRPGLLLQGMDGLAPAAAGLRGKFGVFANAGEAGSLLDATAYEQLTK